MRIYNGKYRWFKINISPQLNEKGKVISWVGISIDIDVETNAISRIKEQNNRLRDIAWIQSHKVRAPLARILGLAEILNHNPENTEEIIGHIANSAHELDRIIKTVVIKTEEFSTEFDNNSSNKPN